MTKIKLLSCRSEPGKQASCRNRINYVEVRPVAHAELSGASHPVGVRYPCKINGVQMQDYLEWVRIRSAEYRYLIGTTFRPARVDGGWRPG